MTTRVVRDLVVGGNIISRSFPAALNAFSAGFNFLSTADPVTLFSSKQHGNIDSSSWSPLVTGGASIAFVPAESAINITVPAGDRAVHQTREYIPYQPGKVQSFFITGTLHLVASGGSGFVSRIGSFDDATDKTPVSVEDRGGDGHFFEYDTTSTPVINIVQRSTTTSGTFQTDEVVPKGSWNIDNLDGTGPSGLNFSVGDLANVARIFFINREWLGVGDVTMGISVNEVAIPLHRFENTLSANTTTYAKRATLPVRYELDNTGGAGSPVLKQICCTVVSMGGYNPVPRVFYFENSFSQGAVGINTHALSIRLKTTHNRHTVVQREIDYFSATLSNTETIKYTFSLEATLNDPLVFLDHPDPDSCVQYSVTTTTVTDLGKIVATGYISATGQRRFDFNDIDQIPLSSSIAGDSRVLTLSFQAQPGTNVNTSAVILSWAETS